MAIAKDKKGHAVAGFIIATAVSFAFTPLWGMGVATMAGAAKELYDLTGRGTPELNDLWYTMLGGAIGSVLSYVIITLVAYSGLWVI